MTEHDKDHHARARARELEQVRAELARLTDGHKVLELGCGSGAASEAMVPGATCVVATGPTDLPAELGGFGAVFMGFGWSRLTRDEQEPFLKQLRARVGKDVLLILLDDAYVEGSSPTIARTDLQGNTYHVAATPEAYWRWLGPVYREVLRVLKPGGFCAIFQGGRYMRHFWDWFGGQGFVRPSVVVRWFRTASSVHRASRRMKPGSQLE